MQRIVTVALVVFGLAAPAVAQTAERGSLAWNLEAGDTLSYGFKWEFRQKEDVGQLNFRDVKVLIEYSLDQTVKSVSDGTASIEAKVTMMKASADPTMMGMPMGQMGFDSANDNNKGNMLRVLRHAVGKTFTYDLSATGKVTNVKGGQAIRDAVSEAIKTEKPAGAPGVGGGMGGMGGMMGPGMMGTIANRLTVAFADETLATTLGIVNHVLPEKSVAEGESWTRDVVEKLPELGSVTFTGKYTHKGVKDGATQIAFVPEGKVELSKAETGGGDANQEAEKKELETMKVLSTKVRGRATWKGDRLESSVVDQTIEAEGEVPDIIKPQVRPGEKLVSVFNLKLTYIHQPAGKQRF